MSTNSGRLCPGPIEVAIRLEAVTQFEGSQPAGVAGVLGVIGEQMQHVFQPGDKVLACPRRVSTTAVLTPGATIAVDGALVCAKPPRISIEAAARVAQKLGLSAAIIARCFPEEQTSSGRTHGPGHGGGETLTAAVLVYLLKRKVENAQIYSTCAGRDDEELHGLCGRLVGHAGAIYAIDADAPELFEHLQASSEYYSGVQGVEFIVDLVGLVTQRAQLVDLLVGRAIFVNEETVYDIVRSLDQYDGMVASLGKLLHDMPAELFRW